MSTKIQIGDLFEIKSSLGLSYCQYTHSHPTHADVLRIFKTKYDSRPADVSSIVNDEIEFTVLCAVKAAHKANMLPKVGNTPVKENLREFPKFRSAANGRNLELGLWWIWDGVKEVKIGDDLSDEQKEFPRLMIRNVAAIIDLIEGKVHPLLL